MSDNDCVVGIDLGTTNSEVAAYRQGRVQVISRGGLKMLPSCVGFSPDGRLLVGEPARNQQLLYPERTVRSIKRKMGSDEQVLVGERSFSPQEISALILRELREWAENELGHRVDKAVITVPAYFSDSQRNATREAGTLAGFEVLRVLNEPTAASLAYGVSDDKRRTVMVYDLGGGTFDVSVVAIEGTVTEVLASHGNNQLGGDDFNDLLVDFLVAEFLDSHGIDLKLEGGAALARVWWAAEEAKRKLSLEPYISVLEEELVTRKGKPLHLDVELSRDRYEDMIRDLVESTLDSVVRAMDDAGKSAADLDSVVLVGGSTRTPLVMKVLEERTGIVPRQEIDPDLCVVLGAGILASRLAGHDVDRVLVDVSPFSFGPSYVGERGGMDYPHCYRPVIRRNTPLPITRTELYYTAVSYQTTVIIEIFQGDDPDALKNILVGSFKITGLTEMAEANHVLCRMSLDLDGILRVTAIEKKTGMSKQITIADAFAQKTPDEIKVARDALDKLHSERDERRDRRPADSNRPAASSIPSFPMEAKSRQAAGSWSGPSAVPDSQSAASGSPVSEEVQIATSLIARTKELLPTMHDDDRDDAMALHQRLEAAVTHGDMAGVAEATAELKELLFFVAGK